MNILEKYPKKRIHLPDEFKQVYQSAYFYSRSNKGAVKKIFKFFTNWMHIMVAEKAKGSDEVLELGAGNLSHLAFEKYNTYDVIEPFDELYDSSVSKNLIRQRYRYSTNINFNLKYDRILSIATLEHLTNLPYDIAILARQLKDNGIFQSSYPSEGGFLWYLGSRYVSGLNFFLKYRLNFDTLLRFEHVNTAKEIEDVVGIFFKKVKVVRFPFNLLHGSLFCYIEASEVDKKKCEEIILKYQKYSYETIF